jgi:hypothetical protein
MEYKATREEIIKFIKDLIWINHHDCYLVPRVEETPPEEVELYEAKKSVLQDLLTIIERYEEKEAELREKRKALTPSSSTVKKYSLKF